MHSDLNVEQNTYLFSGQLNKGLANAETPYFVCTKGKALFDQSNDILFVMMYTLLQMLITNRFFLLV
jgi:hypothetical protein